MAPFADLSTNVPLDPGLAALPLKLQFPDKVPAGLKNRFTQEQWNQVIQGFLERATVGTLWQAFSDGFDIAIEQQEELSQHSSISERLNLAIIKEQTIADLLDEQRALIKNLVDKGAKSGELVGPSEAAKALDISERSLRLYADQGIVPCLKVGKHRKYDLAEVKAALIKARNSGKIGRSSLKKDLLR